MTPQQRLALLGAVTLIRLQRERLDLLEAGTAELVESFGGKIPDPKNSYDTVLSVVQDWVLDDRYTDEEIADKIAEALVFQDGPDA